MSLNYGIIDTIKLFYPTLKNSMFVSIIIGIIILNVIYIYNSRFIRYVSLVLSSLCICGILYYYIGDIITFNFRNPINNIYFYFFNSIIYLIISTIIFFKDKYKNINYICYCISIINISYSIFMTCYLNNSTLMVIANIFPMVKFGNILYIFYYILLIWFAGREIYGKRKNRYSVH